MIGRFVPWIASALFVSSLAVAAPVYDSPEWGAYLEQGQGVLPNGVPSGPGSIASVARTKSSTMLTIERYFVDRPVDMSSSSSIRLSDGAIEGGWTYGTQTMRDFLEATATTFKNLSGKSLPVPVVSLLPNNPQEYEYPYSIAQVSEIRLGVFAIGANQEEVVVPGARAAGSKLLSDTGMRSERTVDLYKRLDERMARERVSWVNLDVEGKRQYAVSAIMKSKKERAALDRQARHARKAKASSVEYDEKQYLEEMKYILAMPPEEQGEALEALHDEYFPQLKSLTKKRADRSHKGKAAMDLKSAQLSKQSMWWLFEAILTQTGADVISLNMPASLYVEMIDTAKALKRPEATVDKFRRFTSTGSTGISVRLGCSVRDRFLGCSEISPKTDEITVNRARKMLSDAANLDESRQVDALLMVSLAQVPGLVDEVKPYASSESKDVKRLADRIPGSFGSLRKAHSMALREAKNGRRNAVFESVSSVSTHDEVERLCSQGKDDEYQACLNEKDFEPPKTAARSGVTLKCEERVKKMYGSCEDSAMPELCQELYQAHMAECAPKDNSEKKELRQKDQLFRKANSCKRQSEQLYGACVLLGTGVHPGAKLSSSKRAGKSSSKGKTKKNSRFER